MSFIHDYLIEILLHKLVDFDRAETDLTEGSIESFDWAILLLVKMYTNKIHFVTKQPQIFLIILLHILYVITKIPLWESYEIKTLRAKSG